MSLVDITDWTPEEVLAFEEMFREIKTINGNKPLALTPEQRDIAVQLGLMPPLSLTVEVRLGDMRCRGLLHRTEEDGIYRGSVHPVSEGVSSDERGESK